MENEPVLLLLFEQHLYAADVRNVSVCDRNIQRKRSLAVTHGLPVVVFGIYIFLMLWEANNRQMYNQMPGLILGAVLSLREILLNKPIKNSD